MHLTKTENDKLHLSIAAANRFREAVLFSLVKFIFNSNWSIQDVNILEANTE